MKRRQIIKRYLLAFGMSISLAASSVAVCYGAPEAAQSTAENLETTDSQSENTVDIRTVDDFLELVENCGYDNWSVGRTVRLVADLDLSNVAFEGIPYFNGVFEGGGHKITNVKIAPKGSGYGFFRYVGETGVVKDLHITGIVLPTGSQENIGGLAGVNYGWIENSSFHGNVSGIKSVGAIAGNNKKTGNIVSCTSEAIVLATNETGGIAGANEGMISGCTSKSAVNTEELEPTLDLGGVDMGSFNFTKKIVNRNDMGGIAGTSNGMIVDCRNEGTIGFKHTGYNVGGIVGSQKGVILTSENKGKIFGRKDVGGIVGQAEPYVESEYLNEKVQQTKDDINRLNRTLNNISSTMSETSAQVRRQAESLNQQYEVSMENLAANLDGIAASAQGNPEAKGYVDNINHALDNIHEIQSPGGELTQEQKDSIQNQLNTINENLNNLQGTYDGAGQSVEDFKVQISDQIQQDGQNPDRNQEIKDLAETLDRGIQSVTNNMKSAVNQMENITNKISDDISSITGDEEIVKDISSVETAENMDGVVSGCINYGSVQADLNAGGIAGTMNIEYDGDAEFDLRLRNGINVRLRSTVNDVIIHSVNYGTVTVKKNCAGGIAGLQELGYIYDCEGYGSVESDSGNYLGGIAGDSAATVETSYTLCNLSGTDYVGGICGSGYSVKDSISVSRIESDGERIGSIAGYLEEEGGVKGNIFVSSDIHGVDNISYAGVADKRSYDEVMEMDGIPERFHQVTILFETEDGGLAKKQIAYGGSLTEADFPDVPEKEGCYVEWPGLESLTDIRENLTVAAEYIPWMESVAGKEEKEDGRPVFLVVGEFYEDTEIEMHQTDGPQGLDAQAILEYAYSWNLTAGREKEFDVVEAHLAIPEGEGNASVWVREEEQWSEVSSEPDGSYLVAELPYGADFAVVLQPEEDNSYLIIAGGAAVLLILVVLIRRRSGKKKTGNEVFRNGD